MVLRKDEAIKRFLLITSLFDLVLKVIVGHL
jgi:hypothetical protein